MKNRSALAILFVIVFIDLLGFGMVIPVMPLYAERLGASEAWTGLLSAGYSAMQFVFAPIWGRLSDRVGRRPVLLVSIAMTAVAFALYGLAGTFAMLLVSRLFAGAATANIAIARAFVADVTPPEGRARGMGIIGAAFGLGFVLGPALGGVLSQYSLSLPGFAAAGLAAANGIAAWAILPEPEHRYSVDRRRRFAAMREELGRPGIRRIIGIYFVTILAFSAMEATYAFLAKQRYGLAESAVSYVFAYIGVLLVLVQGGLIGRLSRRFGEKRLLVTGLVLQALALAALPFAGTVPGLLVATAPLAVGAGLTQPTLSALLSRFARAEDQGGTLGIGESAAAFGRILGPEAGTWTFGQWSIAFPYLGGAALMAFAAAIGVTVRPAGEER
ncbi:tetracycline resistance MFS efflux pump [Anaeromyxobacter sp. Fw109-5]|uniref:MFS transporter n=1 Tax=Anaeromyxobacter sp. (strain Fw109-5) TaxID=404589 RepID=UPI0000ED77A9|nr:tetracycline resistance MFS efflux pump [Anaeromyxobacter sp. Fw109-5]ABS24355.1 major facilitator superfamily MFS_1 [Anaeromyxobacter sp. Fw109-5]